MGTQPHIAPAFTVWPYSGGKLYLCVCNGEHNGVLVGPCVWIVCYSEQCVLYFGNSTYISFSLDFGCSFLSWCDSPRIWPTKCWKKHHSLTCASSLCFNNIEQNVMVGVNDFGSFDVFLDQNVLLVLELHSYQRNIVVYELWDCVAMMYVSVSQCYSDIIFKVFCLIAKFLLYNYTTHNPKRSDFNPPIREVHVTMKTRTTS